METVPYYDLYGLWPVRHQPPTPAFRLRAAAVLSESR
jgi:hypothetical protein